MSRALSSAGFDFALIDYDDGYVVKLLRSEGIRFTLVLCDASGVPDKMLIKPFLSKFDSLIIFQTHLSQLGRVAILGYCRVLVWEVHKGIWNSLDSNKGFVGLLRIQERRLVHSVAGYLLSKSALCVLEKDSIAVIESAGICVSKSPLLIPIPVDRIKYSYVVNADLPLSVGNVGRAVEEKMVPAAWAFTRIALTIRPIPEFHVATDNPVAAKRIFKKISADTADRTVFHSGISGVALDQWLLSYAGVYIGMGTTVLEAAKLGIPSVVIDGGAEPYPQNAKVRLFHKCEAGNLGRPNPCTYEGLDLEFAYAEICKNIEIASRSAFEKVSQVNSPDAVMSAFILAVESSQTTVSKTLQRPAAILLRCIDLLRMLFSRFFTTSL